MNNTNLPLFNVGAPQGLVMNPISIQDMLALNQNTTVFFYPSRQGDIPNINGNAFNVPGTTIAIFYNLPLDGPMNDLGNPVLLSLLNIRQALNLAFVMANGQINRLASGMEETKDHPKEIKTKDYPKESRLMLRISRDLSSVKVTNENGELIEDDVPAGPSRANEVLVSDLLFKNNWQRHKKNFLIFF